MNSKQLPEITCHHHIMKNNNNYSNDDLLTLDNSGCKVNEISIHKLFQYYNSTKFIYPAKAQRLEPYLLRIQEHWKKALKSGDDLIRIVTYETDGQFASVMMLRNTTTSWIGQHLISTGHRISHIPMLAIHGSLISNPGHHNINHFICWYRPDNKIPDLFFGSSLKVLGCNHTSLTRWNYYECIGINPQSQKNIHVEYCNKNNFDSFISFAKNHMDPTWLLSEELDRNDIGLESLNEQYKRVGLHRYRRILMAYEGASDTPKALAICNRAPLGMNLSFLENKVTLLFTTEMQNNEKVQYMDALLYGIRKVYSDFPLNFIPLLVLDKDKEIINQGGHFQYFKTYNQSIWDADAYLAWYRYVDALTKAYGAKHQLNPMEISQAS